MIKLKYDSFYKYDEMSEFLEKIALMSEDLCRLKILARTKENRNIYLCEITDFGTGPAEEKSAYYVQANMHTNEVAGTTAALHLIYSLLYCDEYKKLLEKVVFYIVPRVNPDGAEFALTKHFAFRSRFEIIDKKNGLIPKDINNDGYILHMRWQDPTGSFLEDEIDNRIMVRRKTGDKGPFYKMYREGIIKDYDGRYIVSGYREIDFFRNFPVGENIHHDIIGKYPFSEIEIRAIGDFLLSRPNIFAVIDLHGGTPAIFRVPLKHDNDMDQGDLGLIRTFGKLAEEIIGFPLMKLSEYKQYWRKPNLSYGNPIDWFYYKLGVFAYIIELGWGFSSAGIFGREYLDADGITKNTTFMRQILKFHDSKGSNIFMPWQEFDHPQLGKVEIGGLMEGNVKYMYPPEMEETSPKITKFIIEHSKHHPKIAIFNVQKEIIAKNIFRIRATISNIGGFSTNVMNGGGSIENKIPVKGRILSENGLEILSGILFYEISNLNALGDSRELEWFIRGNAGEKVTVEGFHPRAGRAKAELIL
jgi:hypothetical protein